MLLTLLIPLFAHATELPAFNPSWGLKKEVYVAANSYMKANKFRNTDYAAVVDFSQHSSRKRFYLFNLKNKTVERHNVAHGAGSDKNNDGMAEAFSNTNQSHMSALGAYVANETYNGSHGMSLHLDGQEATNSNARRRAIVVHAAAYVKDGKSAGRSWGCPALDPAVYKDVINKIKGGSLLYVGR